jgi:hypothetical protein
MRAVSASLSASNGDFLWRQGLLQGLVNLESWQGPTKSPLTLRMLPPQNRRESLLAKVNSPALRRFVAHRFGSVMIPHSLRHLRQCRLAIFISKEDPEHGRAFLMTCEYV